MAKKEEGITFEALLADFKKGKFPPILFLQGEEPFYIDALSNWLEKFAIPEEQQGFNQNVIYGRDANAGLIINAARRFPMMYSHQLVLIKEAQNLSEKELENLLPYFNKPLDTTILVFCYKGKALDKRKSVYKALKEKSVVFTSEKIRDYHVDKWICTYVTGEGFKIDPKTALVMAEYLGNNLEKIANEVSKLAINLKPGTEITTEIIEKYIGISREFNLFELSNAVGQKDTFKAFQIANYFAGSPKASNFSLIACVGNLYQLFNRLYIYHYAKGKKSDDIASLIGIHPYLMKDYDLYASKYSLPRIKRNIALLLEYDLKAKGHGSSETEDGELLKELVYKLIS